MLSADMTDASVMFII